MVNKEVEFIQAVANALSAVTIVSCLFLKVPQIMSIQERQSADGIYIQAMMMEVTGFSIMTLYNYKNQYGIMTYMEYPIILFQVYVMFYYVLKFKNMLNNSAVPMFVAIYFASVAGFILDLFPKQVLSFLVPLCTPLSGFAKITYIYGMVCSANADAISLTTWIISILSNLVRIFTVYVDSADVKLIINFLISALLSSGVLFTALYYQSESCYQSPRHRRRTAGHVHARRRTHDF